MKATDRFPRTTARLAAVLLSLLVGSTVSLAQEPTGKVIVADVIPVGNTSVPTQRIISLIKTRPGAEYSQPTADDDIRELYKTRSFEDVRVRLQEAGAGKVTVYFQLKELPNRIEEIVYIGAKHLKADDLETITGLRKGMPLNPIANQVAARAIERKYVQEKGRLHARVELIEGDKAGDRRVVFRVTEGPVVKISGISFSGVDFVSEGRLRSQLNSSGALLNLLGGDYNPAMVEADVAKLVEYYKTFGFHDVRVARELLWDDDFSRVKLVFHIAEGKRYRFGEIQLDGPKDMPRDKLVALTKAEVGKDYDENVVKTDMEIIKAWQGYQGKDVVVRRELVFKEETSEVDVRYELIERPPATVGQVIIIGNKTTRQNVILRQVPLYPGQILTYPDIRVAERNLQRLNIFEFKPDQGIRPTVEVLDPDGPNSVKDILVTVSEDRTGSLLFGVGVNSDAGVTGSIVLNERNFDILRPPTSLEDMLSGRAWRGAGQEFRMEAVPGTRLQRYTVSFREPFLLDTPYSLGLSGYYYTRIFNEYDENRAGGRVTVGRRLNDLWTVSGSLRLENVGVHNISPFAPATFQDAQGQNTLVGLRGSVSRDTRDSFLRATEGSLVEVGAEEVFGSYNFPLLSLEGNKFFTVYQRADGSGRWVVAARSQLGWAGSDAPVFERFYAGGFRSLRGFQFRGVGPDEFGYKTGGNFMFLNSLELQVPILANDQLYAVSFVDTGTVEATAKIDTYRVSAGVGLRIVVPMLGPVPIALDFGFPVVKAATDVKQTFSFWVGFFN